ncbi:hypothetical protein EYC84_007880 [Monilinia fructicola]|uniref:Uncharacterized protein n=1 Tax=Monilinia fructicola TaxID=38448 RepID=A0A5M9JM70_MONFR|nr:hypothetical protein EYC84_007880 [Monilinia fructicola]
MLSSFFIHSFISSSIHPHQNISIPSISFFISHLSFLFFSSHLMSSHLGYFFRAQVNQPWVITEYRYPSHIKISPSSKQ